MRKCQLSCVGAVARKAQALHRGGDSQAAYEVISAAGMTPISNPGVWYLRVRLGMAACKWRQALSDLEALWDVVKPQRKLKLARVECLIALDRVVEARRLLRDCGPAGGCCLQSVLEARINILQNQPAKALADLERAMDQDAKLATGLAMATPELAPWTLAVFRDAPVWAVAG